MKLIIYLTVFLPSCALASVINSASNRENVLRPDTLYFGFFFDAVTAKSLKTVTDLYLNSTIENIPEFASFLKNITSKAGLPSTPDYFQKPLDPNTGKYDPFYHVTAKYCGNNQAACEEYEKQHSKFINQTFKMHLTGYVITNRTFGIRVSLDAEQKSLFDDNSRTSRSTFDSDSFQLTYFPPELQEQPYPQILLETQEPYPPPLPVTNTKAHITLGCGPGIPAVTTGPDMLQTIALESKTGQQSTSYSIQDVVDPGGRNMTVTLYKNDNSSPEDYIFVIYPRVNILANATLANYFKPSSSSSPSLKYYSYELFSRGNSTFVMITTVLMNLFRK